MRTPDITFSVIVTFYNQREFVADALDSILAQSGEDIEVVAVDDGSDDGTADVLRDYEAAVKVVVHERNEGASSARNSGAAMATGDYLLFLDGDDAFMPWAFDVYRTIVRARRPVLIFGALLWFEGPLPATPDEPASVRLIEYPDYFRKDRSLGAWAGGTAIDSRAFREAGGWDPKVAVCEDYDLVWRLGLSGPVVYAIEPATALHRAHGGQTTQQHARMLDGIEHLVALERSGRYPGRGLRALDRKACVGGCVLFWCVKLRPHARRRTTKLLLRSWPLVVAAIAVRLRARIQGRRSPETLEIARARLQRSSAPASQAPVVGRG